MSFGGHVHHFKARVDSLNRFRTYRFGLVFMGAGALLFFFVWWPIQAERARRSVITWNEKISFEKARINELTSRYQNLTSFPMLDLWAKRHGPWVTPTQNDIVTISN